MGSCCTKKQRQFNRRQYSDSQWGDRDRIFDGRHNVVRNNISQGNQDSGIRLSMGSSDNLIEGNTSTGNTDYGVYLFQGFDFQLRRETTGDRNAT